MQDNIRETKRECLIIGALLHDIGKFAQRGGEKGKHSVLSEKFILSILKNTPWQEAANFALRHHDPLKYEDKIIQLADWLSAGERRTRELEETPEVSREPLISIFSQIVIKEDGDSGSKINLHYCPPVFIEKNIEKIFPQKDKEEVIRKTQGFQQLYSYFRKEAEYLKGISRFNDLIVKILYLLEKYTLFVPSSAYKDIPEISLFHHLKSTCAIATCLYDLDLSEKELEKMILAWQYKNDKILSKKDFILLKGDISGIQDFIYSVTRSEALKGLRGRSFYLQLLSETTARKFLDEFNLTLCNLIHCGGGNFTILLPNTTNAQPRIQQLYKDMQNKIFSAHAGKLALVIGYEPISYTDFMLDEDGSGNFKGGFGKALKRVNAKLAIEKRRKFKDILTYKLFDLGTIKVEKEQGGCKICGREISEGEKCSLCESFETLSNEIKTANYIQLKKVSERELSKEVKKWHELFEALGYEWRFKKKIDLSDLTPETEIYMLNSTDFLEGNCAGFRFEAIYTPTDKNKTLTLEEISDRAEGIKRWGALRMDVDNLGKIFKEGLPRQTISRFSMLSYMISLFFSMGIRDIVEEKYENCCVVYSGGDDLFILGPWSDLPNIADDIQKNFEKFVCRHQQITISAGIYIAPSKKFPVYEAANLASEAEKESKKGGKNKITFLGVSTEWDRFREIKEVTRKLVAILNKGCPRSFLTILYAGYKEEELLKKGKIPVIRIWRLFYAIKRLMERLVGRQQNIQSDLEEIRKRFISEFKLMPDYNLAIRWAELLSRK